MRSDPLLHDFLVLLSVRDTILGAKRDTIEVAVGAKLPQDWLRGFLWDAKIEGLVFFNVMPPNQRPSVVGQPTSVRQSDNVVNSTSDEYGMNCVPHAHGSGTFTILCLATISNSN